MKAGALDGLSALRTLVLQYNALVTLPAGLFPSRSPAGVFSLRRNSNNITALPPGIFSRIQGTANTLVNLGDNISMPGYDGKTAEVDVINASRQELNSLTAADVLSI